MTYMKRLLLFTICIIITTAASARFVALCDIQYRTHNGWSDTYRAKVVFLSGCEMQPKQYSNEVYVAIWFSEDECAIIKLDVTHISVNFGIKDFKSIYWVKSYIDGKQVNTEYERMWRITSKTSFGSFIDEDISSGLF